ncbi:hypothetical protein MUN76_13185 [Leucobacter rhizosphaerae]|uniref:Ppx/GppA family phosphatase n=1 Tax=Leucobacter rhizosphaerae TaxID=2932245 RepID=A0ABY4FV29_9MICO|nr:hypothetical protein [Leucobacter rhizosphaerae]UOQ59984.1 hypothetical protein MUN76_13185 [Leucobacter rhizosphaerae]
MTERPARTPRRATRPAPEGVDPAPSEHTLGSAASEDRPESWGDGRGGRRAGQSETDEQLRRDRPPHWG